jgi:hypothetical protein
VHKNLHWHYRNSFCCSWWLLTFNIFRFLNSNTYRLSITYFWDRLCKESCIEG